jgi:DNA-binding response OmpR family regulator
MPTVLVADDNAGLRALCRAELESASFDVVEAGDGYAALEAARRERPDAALLDVVMPGLDGMRVAEILAREQPELRIAFLSGRAAFSDQLEGLGRGAADYITKPFDPAELVERVRSLLA